MKVAHDQFIRVSKDILKANKRLRFRAQGWSMFPSIRHNDMLTIEPCVPEEVHVGDILLYEAPHERFVIHRLIRKQLLGEKHCLITKGDFNFGEAEEILYDNVLGRVGLER